MVDTRRPPPSLLRRLRARTCWHGRCFHGLLENRRELSSGESTDSVRSCSGRKKAHGRDSALHLCYRKINCATIIYPTRSDISINISSSIISITFFVRFNSCYVPSGECSLSFTFPSQIYRVYVSVLRARRMARRISTSSSHHPETEWCGFERHFAAGTSSDLFVTSRGFFLHDRNDGKYKFDLSSPFFELLPCRRFRGSRSLRGVCVT